MEILLGLLLFAALSISFYSYRQSKTVNSLTQDVLDRDEAIRAIGARIKGIERENIESKALFSTVSNVAFDMVLVLDEESTIIMYNQSAERFFGNRNPVGEKLSDVFSSPELNSLAQYGLSERDGLEEQFEIDGAYFRAKTQVLDYGDDTRFVGIAIQDITNLVNLNRARRDLVANISHELRTPITRIRLIIDGLFLEADRPKRKASIQSLKEIAVETDELLWLAQELLDLSMIESGQAIMRLVPTSLKQLADEVTERFLAQAEIKDITIVSHVPQTFDVLCDADQLKRALGNLIHNAIKWSPENETISITASEQLDEVTLSVFDNGPGVPEDLRERIFERFYQADVSRSGHEGTGLGLAICKHIVEAHGGRIWAESKGPGKGGHFLFTLLKADTSFQLERDLSAENGAEPVKESLPSA